MSRCLSDEALVRVMTDLATAAEHAHVAGCSACAARRRAIGSEVDRIRDVLLTTSEPLRRAAPRPRRSRAAVAALAAATVATLVWIEVTAWKTIQTPEDLAGVEQVEAALADVTAAIFSVNGEPTRAVAETSVPTDLEQAGDPATGCDEPRWLDEAECATLSGLEEDPDSIEMETLERTALDTNGVDQEGGSP